MKHMEKELSDIFHDMKQPLVPISGYIQLIEMELDELNIKSEYVKRIKKSLRDLDQSIITARKELKQLYQDLS